MKKKQRKPSAEVARLQRRLHRVESALAAYGLLRMETDALAEQMKISAAESRRAANKADAASQEAGRAAAEVGHLRTFVEEWNETRGAAMVGGAHKRYLDRGTDDRTEAALASPKRKP